LHHNSELINGIRQFASTTSNSRTAVIGDVSENIYRRGRIGDKKIRNCIGKYGGLLATSG